MNKKRRKYLIWSVSLLFFLALGFGIWAYTKIFMPNIKTESELYVKTGTQYDELLELLSENDVLQDSLAFIYTAKLKRFKNRIMPGRYIITKDMSNHELINMIRGGKQTPVRLTFNNIRDINTLAGRVAEQIEADSVALSNLLNDSDFIEAHGFSKETVLGAFIPDTYEFYWNTSAKEFFDRMMKEYQRFWTEERLQKAEAIGLSPKEVTVLASIVQAEQSRHDDEKARIAGLYINRLERGMPLESDPTLIFAGGDFTVKRVLNKDKEIDSPYNTYMYRGLPPGPINMPDKASLKAVLNYEKNDYIFMCAKADFSGYHHFSKSLRKHNEYRREYQRALNKLKVYR
jgi:UPF0755 protein